MIQSFNKQSSLESGFNAFDKSIGTDQPAHSTQADLDRSLSPWINFSYAKGPVHLIVNSLPTDKNIRMVQIQSTCRRQNKCD